MVDHGPDDAPTPGPEAPPAAGDPAERVVVQRGIIGQAKRLIRIVFAFTLILIGALFALVPLIPGWPLAILGLSILGAEFVWARRLLRRLQGGTKRFRRTGWWRRRKPRDPETAQPAPFSK